MHFQEVCIVASDPLQLISGHIYMIMRSAF